MLYRFNEKLSVIQSSEYPTDIPTSTDTPETLMNGNNLINLKKNLIYLQLSYLVWSITLEGKSTRMTERFSFVITSKSLKNLYE